MITSSNLKEYFEDLNQEQIETALNQDESDFLACTFNISNSGYSAMLDSIWLGFGSLEDQQEVENCGGFIVDKDEFLRLYVESGANNPHLQAWL